MLVVKGSVVRSAAIVGAFQPFLGSDVISMPSCMSHQRTGGKTYGVAVTVTVLTA